MAWRLKDRAAAERWIARLGRRSPAAVEPDEQEGGAGEQLFVRGASSDVPPGKVALRPATTLGFQGQQHGAYDP